MDEKKSYRPLNPSLWRRFSNWLRIPKLSISISLLNHLLASNSSSCYRSGLGSQTQTKLSGHFPDHTERRDNYWEGCRSSEMSTTFQWSMNSETNTHKQPRPCSDGKQCNRVEDSLALSSNGTQIMLLNGSENSSNPQATHVQTHTRLQGSRTLNYPRSLRQVPLPEPYNYP